MTLHVLHAIGSLELATLKRQGKINYKEKHRRNLAETSLTSKESQLHSKRTNRRDVPPARCTKVTSPCLCFPPEPHDRNLTARRHQINLDCRPVYSYWPALWENVNVMKDKSQRKLKDTWKLNAKCGHALKPGPGRKCFSFEIEDVSEPIGKNLNKASNLVIVCINVDVLISMIRLWLCKRTSLFLGTAYYSI